MATNKTNNQPAASLGAFVYMPNKERQEGHVSNLEQLCADFAGVMLEKLRLNEVKRAAAGLSSNWQDPTWQADCIAQLAEHVKKGDPRDTGILSAFCWYHGWHTGRVNGTESPDSVTVQFANGHVGELPAVDITPARPRIVVLCGSTRFREAFELATERETLAGRIVLSVGNFTRDKEHALGAEVAAGLDELYKRKIEMSDEVLVLNVGGYIGKSTAGEIEHAKALGKRVRYWLDEMPSMSDPHNQAVIGGRQFDLFASDEAKALEAKVMPLVPVECQGGHCAWLSGQGGCGSCPLSQVNETPEQAAPDCGCEPGMCTQMPHNWCRLL